MAQQTLNATAGGPDDNLPTATAKLNSMFNELYALQSRTLNAADPRFAGATNEASIDNAINLPTIGAIAVGADAVFIPASMLPYDARLVNSAAFGASGGRLVREGGDITTYDLRAYGGDPSGAPSSSGSTTAALAAALANIPVGGGTVQIPTGTYALDPPTTFQIARAQTTISMDASATLVLAANAQIAADSYLFTATQGANNVTLLNFTLNGNRLAQSKRIRGIVGFQVQQLRIIRPYIYDFTGAGLTISNCPDCLIQAPIVANCGRTGADGTCENNMSVLGDLAYGQAFYGTGCQLFGGRTSGAGLDGVVVTAPGAKVVGLTANGNGINKTTIGAAGIFVGGGVDSSGIWVTGCTCYDNSACGIDSVGSGSGTTRGWQILNNECFRNGNAGIQVDSAQYPLVEGNRCYDNYQPAGAGVVLTTKVLQKGGIVLASSKTVSDAYVRRNICYDDQGGSATQVWGIQIGAVAGNACSNLILDDNDVRGNISGGIGTEYGSQPARFVTSGYGSLRRNQGYSPTVNPGNNTQIPNIAGWLTVTPGGAVNLLGITTGRLEDICTLYFTNGNATLKAAGGNFVLRGASDVTPGANNQLTFVFDGTFWRETARNF